MGDDIQLRRRFLKGIAATVATVVLGSRAEAALDPISKILTMLGVLKPAPPPPGRPVDVLRVVTMITLLENEVAQLGLKPTPLSIEPAADPTMPTPTNGDELYAAGVPRLVSIIDRTEKTNVDLGDRAGALLAEINASQRTIPELLDERRRPIGARDFATLKDEYAALFASATVRPERNELAHWHLTALRHFRRRYESVARATGVPWYFVGLIHGLEASYNFRAHLHNGDAPLSQRTRRVPAGRPKAWAAPYGWEDSAVDALTLMGFAEASDWSLERTLYRLEAYNGFGYRKLGIPTPYLWSFSNHYDAGKFVADGSFNSRAKSQQCGAATTLKLLTDAGDLLWT